MAIPRLIFLPKFSASDVSPRGRFRAVHHSDLDFSTTTALRFHPPEILLSLIVKNAAIAVLGVPP